MAGGYKAAYGLELAGGRVVLARATRRSAPQVLYAGPADSEEARRILAGAARDVERGSAALAAAVPAEQTVIRRLRAPFASVRKAARVWASLLDVELPFPVEGAVCAYSPPRLDDGGTVAVAAAIRQGDLAAFGTPAGPRGSSRPMRTPKGWHCGSSWRWKRRRHGPASPGRWFGWARNMCWFFAGAGQSFWRPTCCGRPRGKRGPAPRTPLTGGGARAWGPFWRPIWPRRNPRNWMCGGPGSERRMTS